MRTAVWAVILTMLAGPGWAQAVEDVGDAGDVAAGEEMFATYCVACHGLEARGDGEMAAILTILPPDLTRLSIRSGGEFPLVEVIRRIDGRDPLLAHGGVMPIFGEFFAGEDTAIKAPDGQPILTSRAIVDLVAWLKFVQE